MKKRHNHQGIPLKTKRINGEIEVVNLEEALEERQCRLDLIATELGFQANDWNGLALALANKYEPRVQFVPERNKGRPPHWHMFRSFFLWKDVQDYVMRNSSASVDSACRWLSKNGKWPGKSHETLRVAYYKHAETSPMVQTWKSLEQKLSREKLEECFEEIYRKRDRFLNDLDERLKNL